MRCILAAIAISDGLDGAVHYISASYRHLLDVLKNIFVAVPQVVEQCSLAKKSRLIYPLSKYFESDFEWCNVCPLSRCRT